MFKKGLKDVVAVQTKIASVDGERGELRYRGVLIDECIRGKSFEEVAYFLWHGTFPKRKQLHVLHNELLHDRRLPSHTEQVVDALPADVSLMDAIRTAISSYSHSEFLNQSLMKQSIQLTAALPVIIARHYRNIHHLPPVDHHENLSHTANFLWMLMGEIPQDVHVKALQTYLILTMEHGMNASTFAGRVTISTESDITAAITSAIGTMKGPLHGGAPSGVIDLLEEIGTSKNIRPVIEKKLKSGERIMGFGHRIYKTEDPRSIILRNTCRSLTGKDEWLDLAVETESEIITLLEKYKPGRKLYTNVEYYAAAIMRAIHMPPELFTPTFSMARIVGWTAHAMEQLNDNTIFRPQSMYIGN